MKAFFSKVWAWIVANKIVSIVIAGVLVVGVTLSIALPILLKHDHEFGSELKSNDTTHYYVCECGEKKDETAHIYDKEVANETYFVNETDTAFVYNKSCECGAKGTDTFEVSKTVATISNIGSSYVYSATDVEITFETNSDGEVTYTYFEQGSDTALDGAPKNVGNYSVIISIAGNDTYAPVVSEKVDFEITKKVIYNANFTLEYTGKTFHADIPVKEAFEGDEFLVDIDLYNPCEGTYVNYSAGLEEKECFEDISYGGADYENYEIDRATATVTVVFSGIVIDCQNEYSDTINVTAGQVIYFKINGAGGTLSDFWFKATTGSTATYTYKLFRADGTTTPVDSNTTAGQHEIFVDLYYTIDFYLVVTCVTDGEISVTAEA